MACSPSYYTKTPKLKGGRQRQNKADKYTHSGNHVEKAAKEVGDEDEDTDRPFASWRL